MKKLKTILIILVLTSMLFMLTGCYSELSEDDKAYINKIKELKVEQSNLENEVQIKNQQLSNINQQIQEKTIVLNGKAKYIMKINISQTHFSLDIGTHLKDAMNDIDIYIEVSEDYYNKYNVGDTIADDFRVGSAIFKGSFGSWKVKVEDKQIVEE